MRIETKYNINDKFWVISKKNSKAIELEVWNINISYYKPLVKERGHLERYCDIFYAGEAGQVYKENEMFNSKEELIESL